MKRILLAGFIFFLYSTAAAQTDQWTWMGGDSTISHYGVYGNLGIPSSANKPGSREAPMSWTDNTGNLWLFGGHGYTAHTYYYDMNDLWKYNTSTNQWTWVKGDSTGDVYGVGGGTPGVPNINFKPGTRSEGMTWKDNSGNLWLYGGEGSAQFSSGILGDLWKYNIATNMWAWMGNGEWGNEAANYGVKGVPAVTNYPGARKYSSTWTDPSGNLWLYGGQDANTQKLSDLWKYDISTGYWTWMAGDPNYLFTIGRYGTRGVEDPANKLWPRLASISWADNAGNLYLFGGWGLGPANSLGFYNDLWRFNIASGNWAWISGDTVQNKIAVFGTLGIPAATNKPGARAYGNGWIDSNNQLWLTGGQGYNLVSNTFTNDLWKYNIAADQWTWVSGAQSIPLPHFGTMGVSAPTNTPGGRYSGISWMAPGDKMWLFGGQALGTNGNFFMNDLWKFEPILCATATISLQPANSSVCAGANASFVIAASNVISYQWQENTGATWNNLSNNATYSGTQSNTLNITAAALVMNNYQYRCVVNNSCGNTNSAAATLLVSPAGGSPTVAIAASSNPICSGTNVTFTAMPVNGGSTPVYQWKKNGTNTGTNSNTYSTSSLINGDIISCDLTSSLVCLATTSASSNTILMTVNASQVAAVAIAASANNICAGIPVTFTAVPVNGGAAPVYQWRKNGSIVGTNSIAYTDNSLINGDIIKCVMTSNLSCVSVPSVASNQVVMTINPLVTPSITITASANNICAGTLVTFTAVVVNGGAAPLYQWKKNSINVGTNAATYNDNTIAGGDIITCSVTSNANCLATPIAASNGITMSMAISIPVNLGADRSICTGSNTVISAQPGYASYLWQDGSTGSSYTATQAGNYRVTVTDNCAVISSDDIDVTEYPKPGNFLPPDSAICVSTSLYVGANQPFLAYLWNTGSVSPAIIITAPGLYWLEVTDNNTCKGRDSINVLPKQCFRGMYMPSAFSPNGDSWNERLKPILYGTIKLYQFRVYNRYGQLIFESSDPSKGWDGTFIGKSQPQGAYVWNCIYQVDNLEVTREQGSVILIK